MDKEKRMEKNREEKSEKGASKKERIIIMILAGIIVILILAVSYLALQSNKEPIKESVIEYRNIKDWYKEDCRCVAWGGAKVCPEGFILNKSTCIEPNTQTAINPQTPCSKFECEDLFVTMKINKTA